MVLEFRDGYYLNLFPLSTQMSSIWLLEYTGSGWSRTGGGTILSLGKDIVL